MASYNLSELFELVADAVPEREALVAHDRRVTFAELEARANRLAHHLKSVDLGHGDHVGLQLLNGTEYVEGMLACYKVRAVPVNVNYRYVERELEHLFADADLVALVFHRRFGPAVSAVVSKLPKLRHLIVVEDGSGETVPDGALDYETVLADSSPDREFVERADDDLYLCYTGGTTGMPKGVMWTHEDIFFGALGGGDPTRMTPIERPEEIVERIPEVGAVQIVTPPLMHVSGHWSTLSTLFAGGRAVYCEPGGFDPAATLDLIDREKANFVTLVGDAMVRPVVDLVREQPGRWDLSSLLVLASGGALCSSTTKELAREALPNVMIVDGYGSTETGVVGNERREPGGDMPSSAHFSVDDRTAVLDDDLKPVAAGSGDVGRLARRGRLPIGYYNDPEKTAATFVEVHGERWAMSGDFAHVEADGTIVLHGRGSLAINTGGEKVFPEEVEATLLAHPAVQDTLVVGVPDERWGERVVAVVAPRDGRALTLEELQEHCRAELAGYKVPRELVMVDQVQRAPNGKADYRWAKEQALAAQSAS
ncbi:MAG: acyl-CoA synthetase [Actinobacteria bacterium]|nr:acyl-CoA synthetase [Actinomycetota bacterium]